MPLRANMSGNLAIFKVRLAYSLWLEIRLAVQLTSMVSQHSRAQE